LNPLQPQGEHFRQEQPPIEEKARSINQMSKIKKENKNFLNLMISGRLRKRRSEICSCELQQSGEICALRCDY
jgi:hypothetical protein